MNQGYLAIPAIAGFAVSFCIFYSKKYDKPLHCVIGQNCDAVVKSKYGKTFGIENTIPGMAYYAAVFAYGVTGLNGNIFKWDIIYYSIVGAGIASVLFSMYLAAVQAFILKKWCEYCIVSSIASLVILVMLVL